MNATPSQSVCPLLNKHGKDIANFKYGNTKLVEGWILQGKGDGEGEDNYQWKAREVKDCKTDLKSLATGMINELDERFTNCSPEINHLLHACLDVNVLLPALVRKRKDPRKTPVNRNKFAKLGANEFRRIVGFVGR